MQDCKSFRAKANKYLRTFGKSQINRMQNQYIVVQARERDSRVKLQSFRKCSTIYMPNPNLSNFPESCIGSTIPCPPCPKPLPGVHPCLLIILCPIFWTSSWRFRSGRDPLVCRTPSYALASCGQRPRTRSMICCCGRVLLQAAAAAAQRHPEVRQPPPYPFPATQRPYTVCPYPCPRPSAPSPTHVCMPLRLLA